MPFRKGHKINNGSKHYAWNGGKYKDSDGYVLCFCPKHKYPQCKNYVFEHRLVMEDSLERYLLPGEVVHHINGIVDDNRIENLKLFKNQSEHMREHHGNNR